MGNPTLGALVVADAPGHILERIGQAWLRHGKGVRQQLVCSSNTHPFGCICRAASLGHIHWLDTQRFLACASAITVPQVAMVHHVSDGDLERLVFRLGSADAITTVCKQLQIKLAHLADREVWLIPYTVDAQIFRPSADRGAARQSAGIGGHEFVIGFVGKFLANVGDRKGTALLLEILSAARAKWPDICLLLVGPGWDDLAKKISTLGVRVLQREFPNTESTVAAYGLMDVLLVTATLEGGPCTVLEAMACGVPVIASNVGHVPEVVTDGETGFVCPNRTVQEYLEKLSRLRSEATLRQSVIGAARTFIDRERDERVLIPRIDFDEIYRHAAQHYRRRPAPERFSRRLPQAFQAMKFLASGMGRIFPGK